MMVNLILDLMMTFLVRVNSGDVLTLLDDDDGIVRQRWTPNSLHLATMSMSC